MAGGAKLSTISSAIPASRAGPRLRLSAAVSAGRGVVLPLSGLLLWEAAIRCGLSDGRLLPPPSRVFAIFVELIRSGELQEHVFATMSRVLPGFAAGAIAGTVSGAGSGGTKIFRELIDPLVQALRAVPSLAWVPLFILWFGIFETSKIILIATGVFFPVYLGVMQGVASVDRKLIETGMVLGLRRLEIIRRIHFPAVLPAWIVALRTGLGLGFMFVVAAEVMGAPDGLGYLLLDGQQLGKPGQILVALITFAIIGQICDALLVVATKPLLAWQDVERGAG